MIQAADFAKKLQLMELSPSHEDRVGYPHSGSESSGDAVLRLL